MYIYVTFTDSVAKIHTLVVDIFVSHIISKSSIFQVLYFFSACNSTTVINV